MMTTTTERHNVTVPADKATAAVYLSGPMTVTGREDFNYPTFNAAAERLRSYGLQVVNPAEDFDGRTDLPRATYMRNDVQHLLNVDAIVLLEGWQDSPGARLELAIAQELGLQCLEYPSMLTVEDTVSTSVPARCCADCPTEAESIAVDAELADDLDAETITAEAERLVYGNRGADYGHPRDDYTRTAQLWSALLGHEVTPEDALRCMIAVKLSRDVHRPKRDNRVDIAGYALCLDRCETGR